MKVSKFAFAALSAGLTAVILVSCDDDNKGCSPEPTLYEIIAGSYEGTMTSAPTEPIPAPTADEGESGEGGVGEAVNLEVKEKEIIFASFPIEELVTSIVGPENAPEIIEGLGDIEYKVPFTAAWDETGTKVVLTLAPQELKIGIPALPEPAPTEGETEEPKTVDVTVTVGAPSAGEIALSYGGPDKLLFVLNVEKVVVVETELENFVPVTFTFDTARVKK